MAISLRLAAPPSNREILDLSERNPGFQFERSAVGELVVTPGSSETGRREAALVVQLGRWAEVHGQGVVFGSSAGFHLPDGSLLSPDAAWMPRERWMALTPQQRDSFAPLCPDAVFEIASKTDKPRALRAKMRTYVTNGARLAVLVDPQHKTVEVHRPDHDAHVLESPRLISLDPVLPGFDLDLTPIFE
ncbi:MAG: Uma2 family endonuclease [Armatimonadota bacterium]